MSEMNTHQRVTCMFEHRPADRVPITDSPWASTRRRWHREGLPEDLDWRDYFGIDRIERISTDNTPQYEQRLVEETDEYIIRTTAWGTTLRNWKDHGGTPEFLDFTITDRERWAEAKARMTPSADRVDLNTLRKNVDRWRQQGAWITAGLFFGFDVTHSWVMGTERVLMAMVEDPDWIRDIFEHQLTIHLALLEHLWQAGIRFDALYWCDDMGYKQNQFFSVGMYRDLLKPFHARAIRWAHEHGIKAMLHSCGDIRPLIPELIEIGLDALNPLEVKAGMDPLEIKRQYGKDLVLFGGLNAALWDKPGRIEEEMRRVVPEMKRQGGYILASDHSVPDSVSLQQFSEFVKLAKELGRY